MQHSRTITKLLRSEEGRSLPFALVVVAVGALLVSPFLAHVSTSLLGSRAMQGGMNKQYASDAGVEFGIWKLVNDSTFRSQVDAIPGTPVATGPITVNQFTTNITVTALSAGGWTTLADAPNNVRTGGALAYAGGDYIYALRGNNNNDFWRYSISGDSWATGPQDPNDTPNNVEAGGALTYDGTYIYALRGNNQTTFWRYSISGNNWTTRTSTPARVRDGGALTYDGTYIYALRGNNQTTFWRYSISGNNWATRTSTPARVRDGGALVYTGGTYIYALRGNGTDDFWRYSISGNSWATRANAPANVGAGGALVWDGGDYIYALRGNGTDDFWRYSISGNSWATGLQDPDDLPAAVGDGGALTYDGTYIYAFRGNNSRSFWRFSPGPSTYDITATADGVTISAQVVISGTDVTIQAWEIE